MSLASENRHGSGPGRAVVVVDVLEEVVEIESTGPEIRTPVVEDCVVVLVVDLVVVLVVVCVVVVAVLVLRVVVVVVVIVVVVGRAEVEVEDLTI